MEKYEFESPYRMSDREFAALPREEQDRAILTWLIVIKLSDAPIANMDRALRALQRR